MEPLSGKAKQDFWAWYIDPANTGLLKLHPFKTKSLTTDKPDDKLARLDWVSKSLIEKHAIIQEWLDSVGIYIIVSPILNIDDKLKWFNAYVNDITIKIPKGNYEYETRQKAMIVSVYKANELYNERHSNAS